MHAKSIASPQQAEVNSVEPILNGRAAHFTLGAEPNSKGFVSLLMAYRASGGTLSGDELIQVLVEHRQADYTGAAHLIASRQVFGFTWRSKVWVPMFQFELRNLTIRPECHLILAELAKSFDDWGTATWFAHPNSWLNDRKPIDVLNTEFHTVLSAADSKKCLAAC